MSRRIAGFVFLIACVPNCFQKPQNVFTFCRDFDSAGCITPQVEKASFTTEKSLTKKTVRDFANSIYFRGDRLAFEVQNTHARWPVNFECLKGHYYFENETLERHELEYLELREKNVYGLVMLGSLIEKKFAAINAQPYKKLPEFTVTYAVFCGKDLLAKRKISIELK